MYGQYIFIITLHKHLINRLEICHSKMKKILQIVFVNLKKKIWEQYK